jgi:hypothetical protein
MFHQLCHTKPSTREWSGGLGYSNGKHRVLGANAHLSCSNPKPSGFRQAYLGTKSSLRERSFHVDAVQVRLHPTVTRLRLG